MAPKARQAKSKARLGAYEKLSAQDAKEKEAALEIYIPNGPRLGNKVIEFHDVSKAYGDKLLFEHLSFVLPPAGIVGVIGPNGAGKTTLFRMIMGLEAPDSGDIEIGETVKLSYVDQQHKSIDPEKTVYQTIAQDSDFVKLGRREVPARAYVSRFNFSGQDQEKLCGVLSGGERNRLHLALTLKDEGNVLLLDEPTAALDPKTAGKVLKITDEIVHEQHLTTLMITHNMRDALKYGNRLIMMNSGTIIADYSPEEKQKLTIDDLLKKFEETSGAMSDRVLLG